MKSDAIEWFYASIREFVKNYINLQERDFNEEKISNLMCKGSCMVFDYSLEEDTEKENINRQLAKGANEEMKSKYSYQELELKLQEYNLLIYEHLDNKDIDEQYFKKYNSISDNKIYAPKGVNYCLVVKR